MQATTKKPFISKSATSRLLGVSRDAVDRLIEDRRLGVLRLPGLHVRIRLEDVERLLNESLHPADPGRDERPLDNPDVAGLPADVGPPADWPPRAGRSAGPEDLSDHRRK